VSFVHASSRSLYGPLVLSLLLVAAVPLPAESQAAPAAIEEGRFVPLGGIQQWITIRGADHTNPVLLLLHGGPGDAQSSLVSTYAPLEHDFVVVQWDQRGGGKTLALAGSSPQVTSLELLTHDAIELAEYIRAYLDTKDVILVGHSWGSFLGVHVVMRRPELFAAFVGTGQVVSWSGMVETQYRYSLDRARAEGNAAAVDELEALGVPAPDRFDQYLVMRKWLNKYLAPSDGQWLTTQDALLRSTLTADELKAYRVGFQTMTGLAATVFAMDLPVLGFEFHLPIFLIDGRDDRITPSPLAASYFEKIKAPFKRAVLIEGAGHFAPMTHMQEFVAALREDLRLLPPPTVSPTR
jgi:pimeloyl-ACP methyl ester carboxylesterase